MPSLSSTLFRFKGQCVESLSIGDDSQSVIVRCRRDKRFKVKEPGTQTPCTVDHYIRRRLHDLPV
ncbi:ISL3 family transposase, partial [Vibrio profundum]